jgi:hypothetical protein
MSPTELQDRYTGCPLGLAVWDALGTTLEFKPPGTFEPITDLVGGGPFHPNLRLTFPSPLRADTRWVQRRLLKDWRRDPRCARPRGRWENP